MLSTCLWKQGNLQGIVLVIAESAALVDSYKAIATHFERCKLLFYQKSCIMNGSTVIYTLY